MTPADLRAAATRLRHHADQLGAVLDPIEGRAGAATWIGPAADDFRGKLAGHRANMRSVALDVQALARRIDARAYALEIELLQQRLLAEARAESRPML